MSSRETLSFIYRLAQELESLNPEGAHAEMKEILRFATNKHFADILFDGSELTGEETARIESCVKERLDGKPLAYIVGEAPFMDFDLAVNPYTLIPRPETEVLVNEAVSFLNALGTKKPSHVLDLGGGSGNIPIGICRLHPAAQVDTIEISSGAISCLERNIARHGLQDRIRAIHGDYFQKDMQNSLIVYDLIVGNPPYIGEEEYKGLSKEVHEEPLLALLGGTEGDEILKEILRVYRGFVRRGGAIMLEVGWKQAASLLSFAKTLSDLGPARFAVDGQGIERVVILEKT